jgi:tetratricopeptide (TPR) repeat protein
MQGPTSDAISTSYTNDIGEVTFTGVPLGDYRVQVSGDGIVTADTEPFEVDSRKMSQTQWITVRRTEDSGPKPVSAHAGTVSATDLNVPPKARKEVDKANEEIAMQNWKKALEHLNKAVAIAPQYATAYNNLGVLYARMNDPMQEEQALQKAISIDEHFAPALVNYGKLSMRQKNFPKAEEMLRRAVTMDPKDVDSLMLLARAEYMDLHFAEAIATAHQAHETSEDHAFVHYIAARAYQQQHKMAEAIAEFQTFLKEEPKGQRADYVRADMAKMQTASQPAAQ